MSLLNKRPPIRRCFEGHLGDPHTQSNLCDQIRCFINHQMTPHILKVERQDVQWWKGVQSLDSNSSNNMMTTIMILIFVMTIMIMMITLNDNSYYKTTVQPVQIMKIIPRIIMIITYPYQLSSCSYAMAAAYLAKRRQTASLNLHAL